MKKKAFVMMFGVVMAGVSGPGIAQSNVPNWAQPKGTEEAQEAQAGGGFQAPNAFEMMGEGGAPNALNNPPNAFEMMDKGGAPNALNNPPNAFEMMDKGGAPNALNNPPNAFEIMNR
ncbi:hypothetical protein [Halomonas mongoliensis]|uniref:hypothetical protein n=1 Tax=Halomonas mongoliensis TaxID=321265 RepID=UPI00403AF96A